MWRKLKRLGVAQFGDGLVGLPADARTVEALEWVADDVVAAGGSALLWDARVMSAAAEREVIAGLADARAAEYGALAGRAEQAVAELGPGSAEGLRLLRVLRRELRGVQRRDFFPPPQRQRARVAVQALADHLGGAPTTTPAAVSGGEAR